MSEAATVTIDLSGKPCPAPLLGAKKIIDGLHPGESMKLISDCSGTHDDLVAWCQQTGHVLMSVTRVDAAKVAYRLGRVGTAATAPTPDRTLDMRGLPCPEPIVEARRQLDGMKGGEVLRLLTDCTAALDEVPLWARTTAIELLIAVKGAEETTWEFYLRNVKTH